MLKRTALPEVQKLVPRPVARRIELITKAAATEAALLEHELARRAGHKPRPETRS